MELTPEQGRVLGALVEKELTTPQGYPLTDNALLAACNQTTSREPVVAYDVATLRTAVRGLREQGLLRTVHRPGERSEKHRHEIGSVLGLSAEQIAVLAVLLLRGPQTAAELRARTERMLAVVSTDEVEQVLAELAGRGEPLAQRLERQPGRKEPRWVQVLATTPGGLPTAAPSGEAVSGITVAREVLAALNDAVGARAVEATLAVFTGDAVVLLTPAAAAGQDELGALFSALFAESGGFRFEGSDLTVGDAAGIVWFLLVGELVRGQERVAYRLSCVCVPDGDGHRIVQLHGSEPARLPHLTAG